LSFLIPKHGQSIESITGWLHCSPVNESLFLPIEKVVVVSAESVCQHNAAH